LFNKYFDYFTFTVSINEPPNLRHLAFLRDEIMDKNPGDENENSSDKKTKVTTRPKTVAVFNKQKPNSEKRISNDTNLQSLLTNKSTEKRAEEPVS